MNDFIIIIDSKEKKPYLFQNIKPKPPVTIVRGLKTGDYSVLDLEDKVCVERKSLPDLFGSVGNGRQRFEREMVRLSKFKYAALVVESDYKNWFVNSPARSKMPAKAVFRTVIAWSQRYNVHVWPAWNRESGERFTYLILKRYFDDYIKKMEEV